MSYQLGFKMNESFVISFFVLFFGMNQHLPSIKGHCHMINNTLRLTKGKLLCKYGKSA